MGLRYRVSPADSGRLRVVKVTGHVSRLSFLSILRVDPSSLRWTWAEGAAQSLRSRRVSV